MSLSEIFGNLTRMVRQNGGIWGSLRTLYRTDDLKDGDFVGTDRNGNRYYQNKRFFLGKSRWVIYNEKYGLEYDASQIDPEWHGWIHYTTDEPPTVKKPITYKWVDSMPEENLTATRGQYVPYSTVKPKVEAWIPKSNKPKN